MQAVNAEQSIATECFPSHRLNAGFDFAKVSQMAFNAVVKSEPRSAAKGQFQCQIRADGVTLSQRKKEITISIGVEARYDGENRIEVNLPDCRLVLSVKKFGCYEKRLARDVAAFLSDGGNPPDVKDYSIPWYFYMLTVLPIGIPIVTLGGAIPALAGFGLASVCFEIAQKEEWSTRTRLLASGALVLAAYTGILLLMAINASRG
jgi:hypothetical protein